jgi:hypothetical protein
MNAISPAVQAVLDLFTEPLRDVRFADVDATTLAEHATGAQAAADIVASAEAELARARQVLQERQDALLVHAQRALAYARVFAEADAALTGRLDQIALPRAAKRPRAEGDALALQLQPAPAARTRPARLRSVARSVKDEEPTLGGDLTSTG